ncbi:MAG: HAD family hydrolase [Propionibacteriaceae bacterium]|jgi:Cof subfamily protein (haloacid dehalogenase superfamily)|nr:HAD family hydrolase [Propionibacteriaceae bacterium]
MIAQPPTPPIRLIASDLDGTFLGRDGRPSPANRDAVFQAAAVGVPTVFATGRPSRWLDQPLASVRDANPLVITSNGGAVADLHRGETLRAYPLDPATATAVVADIRTALPGASFAVEYTNEWGREERYFLDADFKEAGTITDAPALLARGDVIKLLVRADLPTTDLMARVSPVVGGRLNVTFSIVSQSGFLEMSRPGVSKASTLLVLLDEFGIDPADVAAFGDMPNDLPLLDLVGHPFVMDNAHPSVKARGYPVCGHHDESAFAVTVRGLLGLS